MASVSALQPGGIELPPEWQSELFDPAGWSNALETFAHTVRMAVALTDPEGHLLGPCHNPQEIWTLAREALPESQNGCSFCLSPQAPCTAVREAMQTGEIAIATDGAGLAHIVVPLSLDGRYLAGLMAGQVFDRYPESLRLQRTAREFGIPAQQLWQMAIRETPVSRAALRMYGELLKALGQAFLRQRYGAIVERKLNETNTRLRLFLDSLKEYAVFTIDAAGRVASWNVGAERLLGYTAAEIAGREYSLFFTPEDIERGAPGSDLRKAMQDGTAEGERWQVRKDGSRFLASSTLAAVANTEGREFGRILLDITERRRSEETMFRAQKQESIGVLAGGVAHDFNNLVQGILVNAALLLDDAGPLDPSRRSIEDIIAAGGVAAGLVVQLLAFAGRGSFLTTRFDISELVADMLRLIRPSVPKRVDVKSDLPAGLPWIEADATQIRQIVMNLVINSGEAIGSEGGAVWVTTGIADPEPWEDPGLYVYIEVRDSGIGMDEATRAKIFDPYFTTKSLGRGLGLAAVSGIVRRHKGKLEVWSAPGKGSTFRVVLPALA